MEGTLRGKVAGHSLHIRVRAAQAVKLQCIIEKGRFPSIKIDPSAQGIQMVLVQNFIELIHHFKGVTVVGDIVLFRNTGFVHVVFFHQGAIRIILLFEIQPFPQSLLLRAAVIAL